ncbi:MAG: hypothetical protein CM15mP102_21330 [Flavobacteriales bacterium]|nr:MAG: hypothetical protein CM15mP102_21330 [Flavobacteriales bacterium]
MRKREIIVREKKVKNSPKFIGFSPFSGMIYQGILGGKMYNGDYSVYDTHKNLVRL